MARIKWIGVTLAVALAYFAGAQASWWLAMGGSYSMVWLPAGIGLGLMLLYGTRLLPGIFLGALVASFYQVLLLEQSVFWSLSASVAIALGNASEVLVAMVIIQRFAPAAPFESLRGVVVFLVACLAGSALATLIASFTLLQLTAPSGFSPLSILIWFLADLVAMLLLAPCIALWGNLRQWRWSRSYLLHLFVYAGVFLAAMNLWYASGVMPAGVDVLGGRTLVGLPPAFLLLPLFLWGALVFGMREVSLLLFLYASFALYRVLISDQPLDAGAWRQVLIDLQLRLCIMSSTILAGAVALSERRRGLEKLADAHQEIEAQWRERIRLNKAENQKLQLQLAQQARNEKRLQEHEERLALITQVTTDGIWEWEPPSWQLRYSSRFKSLLGFDQFDQLPASLRFWLRRMPAQDRATLLRNVRDHLARRGPLDCTLRLYNKAGAWRWYRVQGHAIWNEKGQPVLMAGSVSNVYQDVINRNILLGEKRLLERMTSGASLQEVLLLAADLLLAQFAEAGVVIALADATGVNLRLMAQRRLQRGLLPLLSTLKVGPQSVSVGAAIYFNSPVIVDDIERHAEWRPYLPMLRNSGVRACWAIPIRNWHGSVLGSLAVTFVQARHPEGDESEFLDRVARLAGIAVEQDRVRTHLQRSEQRFRELYHHNPAMFFSLTPSGTIVSVNKFGAEHLGYEPTDLVDRDYADLIVPESRDTLQEALTQALAMPGKVQVFEARTCCADGRLIWVRDSLRALSADKEQIEILVVSEDITDIHELSERLSYHASHDPLTGLVNRRKFEAELVNAIYEATARQATHALCYLDLDMFKVINDTCGHAAGDELLRQLGKILQETVAEQGVIARLGGDEFGLLILNTDTERVMQLAGRVRDRIAGHPFIWERRPYHVGVSIGVAMIDSDTSNLTSLMSAADSACYAAKESGRNRIQFYREDDDSLVRRRGETQWATQIPRGIREQRFALAVQEIRPLTAQHQPPHLEVLLRYRDQDGQWILPQVFLPAAERYGLISLLDRWVFTQLTHLLQSQPLLQRLGVVFSLNLSGASMIDEEFQSFLFERIQQMQLPARQLCFEISEADTIRHLGQARHYIEELRSLGCRFALDDFGSGLVTFNFLKSLPVDFIKVDGPFLGDIAADDMDLAIVRSITDLAHALGKRIIAKGVENATIARKLQKIGVDWGQGRHLSQPCLLSDWLQQRNIDYQPVQLADQ